MTSHELRKLADRHEEAGIKAANVTYTGNVRFVEGAVEIAADHLAVAEHLRKIAERKKAEEEKQRDRQRIIDAES